MSGRSSIDCSASICPVARIASTTVSARATTTSTGIGGGAPPAPGPPPVLPADSEVPQAFSPGPASSSSAARSVRILVTSNLGLTAHPCS